MPARRDPTGARERDCRIPMSVHDRATKLERLWSRADAACGNRWQMRRPRKRLEQAKPLPWIATGCRSERMALSRDRGDVNRCGHNGVENRGQILEPA